MQQNYQIQGRKSPKSIIGIEQKINQYFSNKVQEKQIIADIISQPQLEEIIPCFSEILNQKRMKYQKAQNSLPHKKLLKTFKAENQQTKFRTFGSNTSNLQIRDDKSQRSNKKFESCCQCFCLGCSRKNSTRIKKPRTPEMKGQHYQINQRSQSNQAIKQYSIVNSQSKCVQMHSKPHSTEERKQNIIHNCFQINHLTNPIHSQVKSQYSESAKHCKQKQYLCVQQKLQNFSYAKKSQPSTREQKPKVAWRVDMQKIEEGKIRKARVEKLSQMYKDQANYSKIKQRSSSNQNKIQLEQNQTNQKKIEQGKQIIKINQTEKDKKKYKQDLNLFKKKKIQDNIIKWNQYQVQNKSREIKMENKGQHQKQKSKSKPIEVTFQNYQSYQLVDIN